MIAFLVFILVLGLLVFVHELGHFVTARRNGVACDEFGFGFPPRVVGVQKITKSAKTTWKFIYGNRDLTDADKENGVVYSLNWIPLGGFVKIKGESGGDESDKTSFASQSKWVRTKILAAGVTMNIILAFVLIVIGMMIGLPVDTESVPQGVSLESKGLQILSVQQGSPAEKAKLKMGDFILTIDGKNFKTIAEVQKYVDAKKGQPVKYNLKRGQTLLEFDITPVIIKETNKGGVGISLANIAIARYPWYLALFEGFKTTFMLLWTILVGFGALISGLFRGAVPADIAGPVGIASMTGQMVDMGLVYVLQFAAMLSLNLAVINILPIPALDGGRIFFILIEAVRGKPMKPETEAVTHNIFFLVLMLLIALVTWGDISKLGCISCIIANWMK